jgi:hypothetical protein
LPPEVRRAVLAGARERAIHIALRTRALKPAEDLDEEEF